MEVWKTVKGHSNYEVSIFGRVRNKTTGSILKATDDSRGYPAITVVDDRQRSHTKNVHRMVAETYIPNPEGKRTVNHKDGNKRNNHITNLEWNTESENILHAYRTGLKHRPDSCGSPKRAVRVVETGMVYQSLGDCARAIGGDESHISLCLSGKQHIHKQLHFENA